MGQPFTSVTNAQKLAHPWKTHRQEKNRQNKQKLDRIIEAHVQYIHNPAALVPPTLTHTHCWKWQAPETPRSHTIPKPTLYLCMNRVSTSAPSTPSLSVSIPPFPKLIPGTSENSNSDTTDTLPPTYNTIIRQEYLGMLIRTRRRRRLRRTKRFKHTTDIRASTPGHDNM